MTRRRGRNVVELPRALEALHCIAAAGSVVKAPFANVSVTTFEVLDPA